MESFARPLCWNVPHWAEVTLYAMIPPVVILFLIGLWWRIRKWRLGMPEPGDGKILATVVTRLKGLLSFARLKEFVTTTFFQWRLSRDSFATLMHLAIFWGMAVLFVGTALATLDQDFTSLLFDFQFLQGNVYRLYELALDGFGVVLILGVTLAVYRRYAARPERLKAAVTGISKWDTFPFLAILLLIAVTGFVAEGLRIAEGFHLQQQLQASADRSVEEKVQLIEELGVERKALFVGEERHEAELRRMAEQTNVFPAAAWAPVGYGLGKVFAPLSLGSIRTLHQLTWWLHALLAFAFILCVPFTKAWHLVSSPINILLRPVRPVGRLSVAVEAGAAQIGDLTWRQLLQIDSCTWCGKCQEVCPSHATGFALSPRSVVQKLDRVMIRAAANGAGGSEEPDETHRIHGDVIAADELWACVTCRACEDVCPVCIEQPQLVIDMRRHLIDQGEIDEGLQDALMNVQRYGNSFGQSGRKRAQWTKSLETAVKDANKEEVEYLWFVGDYASYDQRAQEPTRATARVFQQLGLDFGILDAKEQNAGNDVRRVGEEGLFELVQEKNCKVLEKARFQKIVTTDPHTYNTLKNEYTGNGSESPMDGRPIVHYTELFDQLLREGRLRPARMLDYRVTYHDPCYLGRYNGIYDAPRNVLKALGVKLVEMPRNRQNSFCCGAGGGRIWMKDVPGIEERPAEVRIREALELPDVGYFVVACPKDLAMFQDAVKTVGAEDRLRVVDLGELVFEAIGIREEVKV
ncbi:MAG: 4Fe-4S dicluster domain-containing protein [Pirellulales bacterium]|nr:4Fe-4S dicluster domain-containing protein [Pirellulales bacterium]